MTNLVKQHTPGADRLRLSYDDGCQGGIVARLDVTECPLWVMSGHFAMRKPYPLYPQ